MTPRGRALRDYGRYGSVGIELVLSILLGLWLGRKGDARFHTAPWLTLLGIVVGLYTGMRALFKVTQQMVREAERDVRKDEEDRALWLAADEKGRARLLAEDPDRVRWANELLAEEARARPAGAPDRTGDEGDGGAEAPHGAKSPHDLQSPPDSPAPRGPRP